MRRTGNFLAALVVATMCTLVASAQSTSPPAQEKSQGAATAMTLVGCVERIEPPAGPPGKSAAAPAYKLMDVQPGTGQKMQQPLTPATQFLLEAPASINLSEFQNQRVEVTGTVTAHAHAPAPAQKGETRGPAPMPTSTLTVKSMKVVSTECKAPRVMEY